MVFGLSKTLGVVFTRSFHKSFYYSFYRINLIKEKKFTAMANIDVDFPTVSLLPKKETGALNFLSKYPEYDGRGTVIAIFDSGVDPLAPGLQVTTDGKPKIISRIDASGAGDVITSVVVQAKEGIITGLSGRKLQVPETWTNPSGNYHLGIKNVHLLYTESVRSRVGKLTKEKEWDPEHKRVVAEAHRKLQEVNAVNKTLTGHEALVKKDLEAQIELLTNLEKKYNDVGEAIDCVVYHDGTMWRAVLDTSFQGDLKSCQVMGSYSETFQVGTISDLDKMNYTVNIYDEGKLLEIVTMCSAHGTHVASIAAAHFPDEPERNGLAPGAQIVSITIGDNRIGSMETGTALVRAMINVMKQNTYKIDVINMSYGEHAHWSNAGRLGDLMGEVVNDYGITWVASASNDGPALCTIGSPPDIKTDVLISVGAYVSPEMMTAEFSLREKNPSMPFSWSSRGPTLTGGRGVTVCAPGAAITSVSNFLHRGSQLMNGTSMAAPHVTGAVALLISGLKALSVPYSPYSLKRAIENTANHLNHIEDFAQGHGLLQVDQAFEYLNKYSSVAERDVRFNVEVSHGFSIPPTSALGYFKGIHIRDMDTEVSHEFNVTVQPVFLNPKNIDPSRKIDFNLRLSFACSESWVHYPAYLDLMYMERSFTVKVDPSALAPGAHFTSLKAFDVSCPSKGHIFEVPITVIKPVETSKKIGWKIERFEQMFKPGTVQRNFLRVPDAATWACLDFQSLTPTTVANARYVVHAMQILPKMRCKTVEFHKIINLNIQGEKTVAFSVKGGRVLELDVAKWWASLGEGVLNYRLTFYGLKPSASSVVMHGGEGVLRLEVSSGIKDEELSPHVSLKTVVQPLRPVESKLLPLGVRDVVPDGRQIYELQLTYEFSVLKATEVTPNCAYFAELLYESEYESQLWMLFNNQKQLLSCGDAFPSKYSVKLEKGDYVLRMHVRHEKKELLDKLTDLVMLVGQNLPSSIHLDIYNQHGQAMIQGKKMSFPTVISGTTYPFYIAPLAAEKLPKTIVPGQYLSGSITYAKNELGKSVDTYDFKYVLTEPPKQSNKDAAKDSNKDKEKEKTKLEEYAEAVRELKTSWLAKLDTASGAALYEELLKDSNDPLPVHLARLQGLVAEKDGAKESVVALADSVIQSIDIGELLSFYGLKNDNRPDAAKIKARIEKRKSTLLEALVKKGNALVALMQDANAGDVKVADLESVSNTILMFSEPTDSRVIKYFVGASAAQGLYGLALRYLVKVNEDKASLENEDKMVELYEKLGWTHCVRLLNRTRAVRFPPSYNPF